MPTDSRPGFRWDRHSRGHGRGIPMAAPAQVGIATRVACRRTPKPHGCACHPCRGCRKCACSAYLGATSNSRIDSRRRRPGKVPTTTVHTDRVLVREGKDGTEYTLDHVPKPRAAGARRRPVFDAGGRRFLCRRGFRGWRAPPRLALGLRQVEAEPIDPKGRAPNRRGT
jgi:hypothetical protein